jgi:hypothetical protein
MIEGGTTPDPDMIQRRPVAFRIQLAALLLLPFLFTGCSVVVSDAEAPGTYTANADWGTSTIVLAKDHTFSQTVRLKSGVTKQVNGRWKIDNHPGSTPFTTINLTPFFNVTHDKDGVYSLASAYSIYHVPFGGINIAADPDYGIAHRK